MNCFPVKTRILNPPQDDLFAALAEADFELHEGDVVCVASKVVAIHQGRCVKISDEVDKDELVAQEADLVAPKDTNQHGFQLTINEHAIIANAGIDESNSNGYYTLWPSEPHKAAREIWEHLRDKHNVDNLGVIITDSHLTPMRWGVSGISIGFFGINPLRDYRGTNDLFNRELKVAQTNLIDSIAAAAVLEMGEGNESTPIAIVRGIADLEFPDKDMSKEFLIDPEDDVYHELLEYFKRHAGDK